MTNDDIKLQVLNDFEHALTTFDAKKVASILKANEKDRNILLNHQFKFTNPILLSSENLTLLLWLADSIAENGENSAKLELLKILLENGADTEAKNNEGWTALHMVCKRKRKETVNLLLEHNANVNAKTKEGATPLHFAVRANPYSSEITMLLFNKGAKLNEKNNQGQPPIMSAYFEQAIKDLLELGAKPNELDKNGRSLLEEQALLKTTFCTEEFYQELIIQYKVPYDYVDEKGWTLLHRLIFNQNSETTDLLLFIKRPNSAFMNALLNNTDLINQADHYGFTVYDYLTLAALNHPRPTIVDHPQSPDIKIQIAGSYEPELLKTFENYGAKLSSRVEQIKQTREERKYLKKVNAKPSAPEMGEGTIKDVYAPSAPPATLVANSDILPAISERSATPTSDNSLTMLARNEHVNKKYYLVGDNIMIPNSKTVGSFSLNNPKKIAEKDIKKSFPSGNVKIFETEDSARNYAKVTQTAQAKPAVFTVHIKDETKCSKEITTEFQLSNAPFRLPTEMGKKFQATYKETSTKNLLPTAVQFNESTIDLTKIEKTSEETSSNCFIQ